MYICKSKKATQIVFTEIEKKRGMKKTLNYVSSLSLIFSFLFTVIITFHIKETRLLNGFIRCAYEKKWDSVTNVVSIKSERHF